MKNIFITGSIGFIGFHLSLYLLNKKYKVIGIDNFNYFTGREIKKDRLKILTKFKNYSFYKLDIFDNRKLNFLFKNNQIDIVVNLAALAGVRNSFNQPEEYFNANVEGFYNIINLSKIYKVKKFLFASSSSVYGDNTRYPTNEKENTNKPKSFYALSKKINEEIATLLSKSSKMNIYCLRFFTVYGPYGRPDMLIKNLVDSLFYNKNFKIYGYGKHYRDFTYIDDVVEILFKIIKSKDKDYKKKLSILNIGSGETVQLTNLINLLFRKIENMKNPKIKYIEKRKEDVLITHADNKKIKKKYRKIKFTNIDQGLTKYLEWYYKYYS